MQKSQVYGVTFGQHLASRLKMVVWELPLSTVPHSTPLSDFLASSFDLSSLLSKR